MGMMSWTALGTTAIVRAPRAHLFCAQRAATEVIDEIDAVASRFRDDSELSQIDRAGGASPISARMLELLSLAVWAAEVSEGAVDPTLGSDLDALGYDRDFAELDRVDADVPLDAAVRRSTDRVCRQRWREIVLTEDPPGVTVPPGIALDLGATAKGHAADLAAEAAHAATGVPVLVSLGGDIAVAGTPPPGGWRIGIAADHRADPGLTDQTVTIASGGLATSSLGPRRWWQAGRAVHHVLDPGDGLPVQPFWRTVSVTAATCAEANVAATAALVLGIRAPRWLRFHGVPARLVAADGTVMRIGGWPL
jgi:thiamine biosynthesis lipoprotein